MHSSKEALTFIKDGVTASLPLPTRLDCQASLASGPWRKPRWLGSFGGIHASRCSKGNQSQTGQAFNPLVHDKKVGKLRFITDCREIYQFLQPKPVKLENWQQIFPLLRKVMWAAKIDLKHAYFHLGIAEQLKEYICIQVQDKVFQFQGACFGMSTNPQQWQSVMKNSSRNGEGREFIWNTWIASFVNERNWATTK